MAKFNKMKQEHKSHVLSLSPPPPPKPISFASLMAPPEVKIQELIPKLRNMKVELEFTLTEYCDQRDLIDLKHEHIRSLSFIISRIELLRPR